MKFAVCGLQCAVGAYKVKFVVFCVQCAEFSGGRGLILHHNILNQVAAIKVKKTGDPASSCF